MVGQMRKPLFAAITMLFMTIMALSSNVLAETRVKDIARVQGVRGNQLIGYGLVVGLSGTGDSRQAMFTVQSVANMLARFGMKVSPDAMKIRNVSAVMVTADLPAFAKVGDGLDVLISSIGDARSLQGGTLLMTPLLGADGKTYATAQGPISIGGFNVSGGGGQVQKNHPTAGRIPAGAIVEKEVPTSLTADGGETIYITLNRADFTTASRLAIAINKALEDSVALATDASAVRIKVPPKFKDDLVGLIATIEELKISPDAVARVVVNERTGTVVIGGGVRVLPVVLSHGGLKVEVRQDSMTSSSFTGESGEATVSEETGMVVKVEAGDTIDALVTALNSIGATPRDIIAVLQALRAAGALQAELEII